MEGFGRSRCEEGAALFQSGNLSDMSVICEETTWNVHKAILIMHSESFSKLVRRETTIVDVTDFGFSPGVTGKLLEALYSCGYSPDNFDTPQDGLVFHVTCYAAGVAHGAVRMQDAALNQVTTALSDRSIVKSTDLSHFLGDVYEIDYASSASLRQSVAKRFHEDLDFLKSKDWFLQVLQQLKGFAKDILFVQLDSAAKSRAQLRSEAEKRYHEGRRLGKKDAEKEIDQNICDDHKADVNDCYSCDYSFD